MGTLTEGDILWRELRSGEAWHDAQSVPVRLIPRRNSNRPVHIDAEMEALVARAIHQNFVPVVDDREVFIGIVRRQQILEYLADLRGNRPPHPEEVARASLVRAPHPKRSGSLAG